MMQELTKFKYKTTILKGMSPYYKYSKAKLLRKIPSTSTQIEEVLKNLIKKNLIKEEIITKTKGFKPKVYSKRYILTEEGYQEQLKLKGIV